MQTTEKKLYAREEYLALEEKEERRYDVLDGEIIEIEMGASEEHQLIGSNLIVALGALLRQTACRVMPSGMRMHAGYLDTYPDIVIICGDSQYREPKTGTGRDTLINPIVLREALSPAARDRNQGEKFQAYRTISSLHDFVTIEQERVFVEHFSKIKPHEWLLREYASLDDTFSLGSLGISLSLRDIYDKTDLAR